MSSDKRPSPAEFRPYRRFLTGVVLAVTTIGGLYLVASVGVTIYRRRHAVATDGPVSSAFTRSELASCHEELEEVTKGLEKHLESFHRLLGHYDAHTAQQWSDGGAFWRGQWKVLGTRCHFLKAPGGVGPEYEAMASVHKDLRETQEIYTRELLRFGREHAPRLDRIRERIDRIGDLLQRSSDRDEPRRMGVQ